MFQIDLNDAHAENKQQTKTLKNKKLPLRSTIITSTSTL